MGIKGYWKFQNNQLALEFSKFSVKIPFSITELLSKVMTAVITIAKKAG
jgi:hypothetical protein